MKATFTEKELKVTQMKLKGFMNKKIAEELGVSDADISQTLSRLREKVRSVRDSTELLMEIGVIREGPRYALTEKGRQLARVSQRKIYIPREHKHLATWFDFETEMISETSGIFIMICPGLIVADKKKSIYLAVMSEGRISTLNKKMVRTLPTSEPTQHIETPDRAVFT